MKFLHLSDLHLGRSLNEFDLIDDQKYILDQIIDIIKEKKVDAVLIAGDVYDKAIPSEAATGLLDHFLQALSGSGVYTFMISGNHDSDDRLNYGSSLFEKSRIYISAIYNGILSKYSLKDDMGDVDIYLLPFVKASRVRHFFPEVKIESYEDAVRVILSHAKIDKNHRNILVAHQFVTGKRNPDTNSQDPKDPVFAGSESLGTRTVGLVEKIGSNCFDDFDYVALGHIHSPQAVGRPQVRYCGSPLKYSLSEVDDQKSLPLISLGTKGEVDVEFIPLKPLRDIRHIKGPMEELLKKENVMDPGDFIYATLTDKTPVMDAMTIFRGVYPNTLKIDYDNQLNPLDQQIDISAIPQNKTFVELMEDFYSLMYGSEMSSEERDYIKSVADEAGILE